MSTDLLFNDPVAFVTKLMTHAKKEANEQERKFSSPSFKADILEFSDRIEIFGDLPGVNKQNISIESSKGILTVSGKRNATHDIFPVKENFVIEFEERPEGEFSRSFQFNTAVINIDAVTASFIDGVLRITLPKIQPQKQKISIT